MFFRFSRFSLSLPGLPLVLEELHGSAATRNMADWLTGWLADCSCDSVGLSQWHATQSGSTCACTACSHDRLRYSYVEVYGPENARETFHSSFHCIGLSVCSGGFEMLVTGFIDASLEVLSRPAQGASSSFPRSWRVEPVEAWNKWQDFLWLFFIHAAFIWGSIKLKQLRIRISDNSDAPALGKPFQVLRYCWGGEPLWLQERCKMLHLLAEHRTIGPPEIIRNPLLDHHVPIWSNMLSYFLSYFIYILLLYKWI